jgi:hypothetical protein
MNELIPASILKYFVDNPQMGRKELAKKANISISEARFYCKLFKNTQHKVKIKSVGIAAYDLHYPEHDEACFKCLLDVIKDIKPDIFILAGDAMDMSTISVFNRRKPKLVEGKRIGDDYKKFQKDVIDVLDNALGKGTEKYYLLGNHEERVDRLIEADPKLDGLVNLRSNLKLDTWKVVDYKKVVTIGNMNFTHGIWYNKYHSAKNVNAYQKNIFTGHAHTSQVFTAISPINSLPKQGVSVGCLCNKNPEYRQDEPNGWVNQFMIFYLLTDGTFRYELITIVFGRCVVNGKLYDGNKE